MTMKIVFVGPMGAGKTTAIRAVSDIEPVCTEAQNSDNKSSDKETTTVAMDYGEIHMPSGEIVSLYGIPGQTRFSFMWPILSEGAAGVILLINANDKSTVEEISIYLDGFSKQVEQGSIVVGVGHYQKNDPSPLLPYQEILKNRQLAIPLLATDVREKLNVLLLIECLVANIEAKSLLES